MTESGIPPLDPKAVEAAVTCYFIWRNRYSGNPDQEPFEGTEVEYITEMFTAMQTAYVAALSSPPVAPREKRAWTIYVCPECGGNCDDPDWAETRHHGDCSEPAVQKVDVVPTCPHSSPVAPREEEREAMVERGAKAIASHYDDDPAWQSFCWQAEAVLDAVRRPTADRSGMVARAARVAEELIDPHDPWWHLTPIELAEFMLDAVLGKPERSEEKGAASTMLRCECGRLHQVWRPAPTVTRTAIPQCAYCGERRWLCQECTTDSVPGESS
jgi:hypothetical protein